MKNKQKLLVLTGAGFSMPFLKIGNRGLSSALLNEAISDINEATFYMEDILKYESDRKERVKEALKSANEIFNQVQGREEMGFEEKLYELELICEFIESYPIKSIKATTIQNRPDYIKRKISSFLFQETRPCLISIREVETIKNYLLDLVGKSECSSQYLVKLSRWINNLQCEYDVDYFTLNYDNLYEQITNRLLPNNELNFEVGYKSRGIFQNLHGSVHFIANQNLYIRGVENASKSRWCNVTKRTTDGPHFHAMISGYNKASKLQNNGYDWMYLSFINAMANAEKILVIGYSFQDDHINRIIKYAVELNKEIEIVDKSKNEIPNRLAMLINDAMIEKSDGFYDHHLRNNYAEALKYNSQLKIPGTNVIFHAQDVNSFIG